MKRSTQISTIATFAFAAFAFASAPVSYNIVADTNPESKGSSSGYEFEEVETAQNELDRSRGFEFEEVETARNELDRSKGYEFEEVETA